MSFQWTKSKRGPLVELFKPCACGCVCVWWTERLLDLFKSADAFYTIQTVGGSHTSILAPIYFYYLLIWFLLVQREFYIYISNPLP